MSDTPIVETEIIQAAYADKVKDAFIVFAENLAVGQAEKACKERFLRALMLVKKARDLAIEAMNAGEEVEVAASSATPANRGQAAGEGLSAQDQAMIDAAVGGTTGVATPHTQSGPLRLR
jgi:hypothetical protein